MLTQSITIQEIILAFALIGVLGGWAIGRIFARFSRSGGSSVGTDQRIRGLEAELRVIQRKAEEAELALERHREESERTRAELDAATVEIAARDAELDNLRRGLTEECGKTQRLRHDLAERAEETIRASLRVRDAETELSVARAGSDAVLEQVQRLAAEREELTGRLRILQSELASTSPPPVTRLSVRDSK